MSKSTLKAAAVMALLSIAMQAAPAAQLGNLGHHQNGSPTVRPVDQGPKPTAAPVKKEAPRSPGIGILDKTDGSGILDRGNGTGSGTTNRAPQIGAKG
jgi:hypothetical protein